MNGGCSHLRCAFTLIARRRLWPRQHCRFWIFISSKPDSADRGARWRLGAHRADGFILATTGTSTRFLNGQRRDLLECRLDAEPPCRSERHKDGPVMHDHIVRCMTVLDTNGPPTMPVATRRRSDESVLLSSSATLRSFESPSFRWSSDEEAGALKFGSRDIREFGEATGLPLQLHFGFDMRVSGCGLDGLFAESDHAMMRAGLMRLRASLIAIRRISWPDQRISWHCHVRRLPGLTSGAYPP